MSAHYDVVVIGGGHAGTEAALASARRGSHTLLISDNLDTLGQMSCNPALGGIGKAHIVREVDAMGGWMGYAADRCGIHYRRLNTRKGAAVQACRAQIDRMAYRMMTTAVLHQQSGLDLLQQSVTGIVVGAGRLEAVITASGLNIQAKCFVLTVGTFLGARLFIGQQSTQGGRAAEPASNALQLQLQEQGMVCGRLKTGTPPRIHRASVDFSRLQAQPGDKPRPRFGYRPCYSNRLGQKDCHIGYTNAHTHDIVREHLHESAVYSGTLDASGPRYCPSIEDKVMRFAERSRHQVFLEPEGVQSSEIYLNGVSTGLAASTQLKLLRSIEGLEQCRITRLGYSVEYGYFDPRQLHPSLNLKRLPNFFFGGQINGTTGYEEAAGQGLVAGINASLLAQDRELWIPRRDSSYLGVMIDDLVTHGVTEPYRMFTSRAEHRLLLREDNADSRLTPVARKLDLISERHWRHFCTRLDLSERLRARLKQKKSVDLHGNGTTRVYSAEALLSMPQIDFTQLRHWGFDLDMHHRHVLEAMAAEIKYAGYEQRAQSRRARSVHLSKVALSERMDYRSLAGLSNEVAEKLNRFKPRNLDAAARLEGITPAAIDLLWIHAKRRQQPQAKP